MIKKILMAFVFTLILNLNASEKMSYNKVESVYAKLLPDVVAQVNGKNYTKEDFMKSLNISQKAKVPSDAKLKKYLPKMVIGFAVRKGSQNMAVAAGFTPSKENAKKICDKSVASFLNGRYKKYFLKDLEKKGLTIEQYKEQKINSPEYQQSAAVGLWLNSLRAKMAVTDAEILEYYKKYPGIYSRRDKKTRKKVLIPLAECKDKIIQMIKNKQVYKMMKPGGLIYTDQKIKTFVK